MSDYLKSSPAKAASQETPKIEFPCPDYPIKVLGVKSPEFREYVLSVVAKIAPDFAEEKIQIRDSGKGTFQSMTFFITATGEQQLKDLNNQLRESDLVKMVL